MSLKWVMPRVVGRGAGLGNELIPWARAFVAATLLNAKLLPPAFGLNARRYGRHFDTPAWDWLMHRAMLRTLPAYYFDESAFCAFGGGTDGGDAVTALQGFIEHHGLKHRKAYVLYTDGLWGGFAHIAAARDFVRATLYRSRFAAQNLLRLRQRLSPDAVHIGLHIRLGDFGHARHLADEYRGQFNLSLPLQWYRQLALNLKSQLDRPLQFAVFSDGTREQLAPVLEGLDAVYTDDLAPGDCSDLLALADMDLLVCSVSSFSAMAAFLSDSPYIWFEPQLQHHAGGLRSIWGHEPMQQQAGSATLNALAAAHQAQQLGHDMHGHAWSVGLDAAVPAHLCERLTQRWTARRAAFDLVRYGVVQEAGHG